MKKENCSFLNFRPYCPNFCKYSRSYHIIVSSFKIEQMATFSFFSLHTPEEFVSNNLKWPPGTFPYQSYDKNYYRPLFAILEMRACLRATNVLHQNLLLQFINRYSIASRRLEQDWHMKMRTNILSSGNIYFGRVINIYVSRPFGFIS